jgi:hypothetical protein
VLLCGAVAPAAEVVGCVDAAVEGSLAVGSEAEGEADAADEALAASPLVPDIAAAKAVTCVRTSISLDFVVSSSATEFFEPEAEPVAPVAPVVPVGELVPLADAGPRSSVRILSIAATSVLQFPFPRAVAFDPVVFAEALPLADDFSSAFKCRFSSATRLFARAGTVSGMSLRAA